MKLSGFRSSRALTALVVLPVVFASCARQASSSAGEQEDANAAKASNPYPGVNTVGEDRAVWQQLLSDHTKIRRVLIHKQEGDLGIVEATTESDDPVVAARIIEHAKAMQARMKTGAQVRIWDPVFRELFAKHEAVTLVVTPTEKGVRIVESSRDPEAVALLRSHAIGVSEFVREGHGAGRRETRRIRVGDPLPPNEVAIGGLPHRFLLGQPNAEQVALLHQNGVARFVNFRTPAEHPDFDEGAAVQAAGGTYCNIPFRTPADLTDEVLGKARAEYQAAERDGVVLAPHCRTGNRVGPGLAAYLAVDQGVEVEKAIAAAKAVGMVDANYERIARDYIRRHAGGDAAK